MTFEFMAKLYIVGFQGKSREYHAIVDNNQSVKENLSYGGEASFRLYGDHGAVYDNWFATVMTWDGKGRHYTPYAKEKYGFKN